MFLRLATAFSLFLTLSLGPSTAQDVRITPEESARSFSISGQTLRIDRIQDTSHKLNDEFTKTSRPCPPYCIQPVSLGNGVETVGELEVMDFLERRVQTGRGLLMDSRMPEWFVQGTIPGAVNVPFSTLEASNPYRNEILRALGATPRGTGFDFENALDLMLFCNGPWCDQTPRAIRSLLDAGYPAEKLSYYRGGMQLWLLLGLTVKGPA